MSFSGINYSSPSQQPVPVLPVGQPQGQQGAGAGGPPKKYVMKDGVMQLNPAYTAFQASQGHQTNTTAMNPSAALPVVSNMDEAMEYQQAYYEANGEMPALSSATNNTILMMQQQDICQQVGLQTDEMVDRLGEVFAKHEVPMGLMNKLMMLQTFDLLEFIFDDSGSMRNTSDTVDHLGRIQSRWQEAWTRIKDLIEIMAYVPTPPIEIRFLNRSDVIRLEQKGGSQRPEEFIRLAHADIDRVFMSPPSGITPIKERLGESFQRGQGRRVARYLFCDGEPTGFGAREAVTTMVKTRRKPADNPMTFMSCTDQDHEVEWMKEAEEIAPYSAEYDDLGDEQREVARDQGDVLPYTKGFHLIGQLVGAMNPDDLDAMDESVPFTKFTFDNLYGIQTTDQAYEKYFYGFLQAQRSRVIETEMDRVKKEFPWQNLMQKFKTGKLAKDIPEVQQFKAKLEQVSGGGASTAGYSQAPSSTYGVGGYPGQSVYQSYNSHAGQISGGYTSYGQQPTSMYQSQSHSGYPQQATGTNYASQGYVGQSGVNAYSSQQYSGQHHASSQSASPYVSQAYGTQPQPDPYAAYASYANKPLPTPSNGMSQGVQAQPQASSYSSQSYGVTAQGSQPSPAQAQRYSVPYNSYTQGNGTN